MRLIIATDEIDKDEPLVNYVDAKTFARIWYLVMENKSQQRSAGLTPREAAASGQEVASIESIELTVRQVDAELKLEPWASKPLPKRP